MRSIDELCPQIENDNGTEIENNANTTEVVNGLVTAVKEVADIQADTTNKLVEKFAEIIKAQEQGNGDGNGDGDGDGDGDGE